MLKRALVLIATGWALLLVPPLCLAGGLAHQCLTCAPGAQCQHEPSCNDDPCSLVPVRPDGGTNTHPPAALPAAIPAPAALLSCDPPASQGRELRDLPACRPPRFADTSLPLLN